MEHTFTKKNAHSSFVSHTCCRQRCGQNIAEKKNGGSVNHWPHSIRHKSNFTLLLQIHWKFSLLRSKIPLKKRFHCVKKSFGRGRHETCSNAEAFFNAKFCGEWGLSLILTNGINHHEKSRSSSRTLFSDNDYIHCLTSAGSIVGVAGKKSKEQRNQKGQKVKNTPLCRTVWYAVKSIKQSIETIKPQ